MIYILFTFLLCFADSPSLEGCTWSQVWCWGGAQIKWPCLHNSTTWWLTQCGNFQSLLSFSDNSFCVGLMNFCVLTRWNISKCHGKPPKYFSAFCLFIRVSNNTMPSLINMFVLMCGYIPPKLGHMLGVFPFIDMNILK